MLRTPDGATLKLTKLRAVKQTRRGGERKMDFTKRTYSVIQNGEFTSFKISDGENIIAEWSDNCGLTHVAETVPEIAKPIVARMEAAQRKYYDEWDLFDGQGVYGRDGRTDEFGANWVEL